MSTVLHEKCDRTDARHRLHWVDTPRLGSDMNSVRCPGTPLPYPQCTVALHAQYGNACYECCIRCNCADHRCPACGDELRHDGTEWGEGNPRHACFDEEDS